MFFFFFLIFLHFIFIFGCVGSSFLCEGFLQLWQAGTTLHRGARASHYRDLSLWSTGSRRAGSVVVAHGPSCSTACGIPRPGLEPVSPALAGRFSTTAPPGKPCMLMMMFITAVLVNAVINNSSFTHLTMVDQCSVSTGLRSEGTRKGINFGQINHNLDKGTWFQNCVFRLIPPIPQTSFSLYPFHIFKSLLLPRDCKPDSHNPQYILLIRPNLEYTENSSKIANPCYHEVQFVNLFDYRFVCLFLV